MSEDIYKFLCCYCRGKIRALDEHAGLEAECPHCEATIVVPRRGAIFAGEPAVADESPPTSAFSENAVTEIAEETVVHQPEPRPQATSGTQPVVTNRRAAAPDPPVRLAADTVGALSPYDQLLRNRLAAIEQVGCWEWAVARELLLAHLESLRQAVFTSHEQPTCRYNPREYDHHVHRLHRYEQHYLAAVQRLQEITAVHAASVLFGEDALEVGRFCATLGEQFARLRQLHEDVVAATFPAATPFTEMHVLLAGWAPAIWQAFNAWARQLGQHADHDRERGRRLLPQLAIFPATYPKFLAYRRQLLASSA